MRQLVWVLFTFLFVSQAHAFKDVVVINETKAVIEKLNTAPNAAWRQHHVEQFKDFLYKHLNDVPVPNTPDEDEEYASITEFSGYVGLISDGPTSQASCETAKRDITLSGQVDGQANSEARLALHILAALCSK